METLNTTLFGNVQVAHPVTTVRLKLSHATQALLAYLLLQPQPVTREVLADTFWGEQTPDQARKNLNTAI